MLKIISKMSKRKYGKVNERRDLKEEYNEE